MYAQGEILNGETVLAVSQRGGAGQSDRPARTLRGKPRKVEPDRRAARQAAMRLHGEPACRTAEVEVARIALAGRGQPDVGDGLAANFGADEPGEAGYVSRAPEIAYLKVDLEAFDSVRDDGDRLLPIGGRSAHFRLERAAHLREHERREVVEVVGAEVELAILQLIGADRDITFEPHRGEGHRETVGAPAAVGRLGYMRRALQLVAVNVAGGRGGRLDLPGKVRSVG